MKSKEFVCDGSKSDGEVIQDAVDWASEGEEDDPRLALVTKPRGDE